ncbi:MAG: threonylcarbamoyl-AMP synthase [Verrucomicrobia bacterium]|nr:threonylcarbamoyl-AMP synthase [Verrucomicrobiota bacterium]
MKPAPTARIYRSTPRNLARLAKVLRQGGLVAVPTETVYGLAANALDPKACRKIFAAKGRPTTDPLIVHIESLDQLAGVAVPNVAALQLAQAFWPGPLTLVLPKRPVVPDLVSAGLPSVAVRMPRHPQFRRLLKLTGLPLAAPSANRFGAISPTTARHVLDGLGTKISHILDGGASTIGLESTIVDLRDPRAPRLLRPGAVTKAEIEKVLGVRVRTGLKRASNDTVAQVAPGSLKRHYSPTTPMTLQAKLSPRAAARSAADEAWLFVARPHGIRGKNIFWLDETGEPQGAARRLFRTLRKIDGLKFKVIHAERVPDRTGGLAAAINDRLSRAASRG